MYVLKLIKNIIYSKKKAGNDNDNDNNDSQDDDNDDDDDDVDNDLLDEMDDDINLSVNEQSEQNIDIQENDVLKPVKNKNKNNINILKEKVINIPDNQNLDSILLKDSYFKIYLFDTQIYLNDTIDLLLMKICDNISTSINNNQIFFIPSRIYLWASNMKDNISLSINNIDINPIPNIKQDVKEKNSVIKTNNNLILKDFHPYLHYDIFFIDIYTQIHNYIVNNINIDNLKKLQENFIKIYFSQSLKDFNDIILYIQNKNTNYNTKNDIYIKNKYIIDYETKINQTLNLVSNKNANNIYVTHTIFVCYIYNDDKNINLKNIFNFLKLDRCLIYSKLLDIDNKIYFKIKKGFENNEKIKGWNNLIQYGITLKYLYKEKFITINILKTGLVEIKLQWKESDKIKINQIEEYKNIFMIIINKIKKDCALSINSISEIKIKFINTIQKFQLPKKIDHNKFSYFVRLFYPIFTLVIDPDKRKTTLFTNENSKWGTYLRYKKISNYYSDTQIIQKVLYYLKNFNIDEKVLIDIISTEFNISNKSSVQFINLTKTKYNNFISKFNVIKKKEFKKQNIIFEKKGIEVAIQGKNIDNYKVRIEGAKSLFEIETITKYINKILEIYVQFYIKKNNKFNFIKKELTLIEHIPVRKYKVIEIEEKSVSDNYKILNTMKLKDSRIQNNQKNNRYSRECQNSGDKIRRPLQILNEQDLIKYGYKFNKKINLYEKKIKDDTLYALKQNIDNNVLYYICDEKIHKDRKYIGILSKRKNQLPCCFIKNQLKSKNKVIYNNINNILFPQKYKKNNIQSNFKNDFNLNNIKYIRKLKNIVQNERYFELPDLLNIFFNNILNETYSFYLYGVESNVNLLEILNLFINKNDIYLDIKNKMKNVSNNLFYSLNNGNIYKKYGNINAFIQNLNSNIFYEDIIQLFSILYEFNIIIFNKIPFKDDYIIKPNNVFNDTWKNIFLYQNEEFGKNTFFPIVIIHKNKIIKNFYIQNKQFIHFYNIINDSNKINYQFYIKNNIKIKGQILNQQKLVEFFITENDFLLPSFSEVPIYNLPIIDKYKLKKIKDYKEFLKNKSFFKIKMYIYKDKCIVGIYINVFNNFYNIHKLIPVFKHKIDKYNSFTPLQPFIANKKIRNSTNYFKFNINKHKIKSEIFYVYKFLFSKYSKKFRKDLIFYIEKQNVDKISFYIQKINQLFCQKIKFNYNEWSKINQNKIIEYSFISYIENNNNNNLYIFDNVMKIPFDIFNLIFKNMISILMYDINTKNELLNINNSFISKIIDNEKILIQNDEILYFTDFNLQKKMNTIVPKVESKDHKIININKNIFYQPIKNDNFALIRAFVNAHYYNIKLNELDNNYEIANIGFYSKFQENMTIFYIGEIIKFGMNNLNTFKFDENIFYNIYYNNNISKEFKTILLILSIIINKGIYLEYNQECFLFYKKIQSVSKIKNPNMISIKINTHSNSFIFKDIFVILYKQNVR